jgi:hypothetical protein
MISDQSYTRLPRPYLFLFPTGGVGVGRGDPVTLELVDCRESGSYINCNPDPLSPRDDFYCIPFGESSICHNSTPDSPIYKCKSVPRIIDGPQTIECEI